MHRLIQRVSPLLVCYCSVRFTAAILLRRTFLIIMFFLAMSALSTFAQVYNVKEMNTEEIRALDRNKTVVLLPGGILEQHGPYLPSFTDGYRNERLTKDLANAIVERPGWKVLVFPLIPLSSGGANEIGGKFSFSGTYAIRTSTLRAVFMDLATELGEQGFQWIFIVHAHGAPNHNLALDQAGDYFHDFYDGHMVNLCGLILPQLPKDVQTLMTNQEHKEDGMISVHSGMRETSEMLFLQPNLVTAAYESAPAYAAQNREQLIKIARAEKWPGYFGSPRLASATFGARYWREYSSRVVDLALEILEGFDYQQMKRVTSNNAVSVRALEHESDIENKQSEWLKKREHK